MEYNDEKFLTPEQYATMAIAYEKALKERGMMIVRVGDDEKNEELANTIVTLLSNIRACLFRLGGFLNTGKIYNLNERHIKKLGVILDKEDFTITHPKVMDKTKCFLNFLSYEFDLIKNLIVLKEQSNFESNISRLINERLTLLSQIFSF